MRLSVLPAVLVVALQAAAAAQGGKQVRVAVEFRQTGTTDREALQGDATIVITREGGVGSGTRFGTESRTVRSMHSSGIFTIVQDGGDSMLSVATRVPYEDIEFFRDYATGAGFLARGIAFENVGSSLKVHADVLADERVKVRLTPRVSYFSADGPGIIDFTDASTELVVRSGEPITIGGGTSRSEEVTRRLLGFGTRRTANESQIVLTATVQ